MPPRLRRPNSALTLRGRAFLAAGVTAIACAVVLGQPALVRVGMLLTVLPLLALLWVSGRRSGPVVNRKVWPAIVPAGQTARVDLGITSGPRRATGRLLVEDELPYALGARPRFVLGKLERGRAHTLSYPIRSDLRGHYPIGPLRMRASDPFGLVENQATIGGTAEVLVTPRVLNLPAIPLAGGWQGTGERVARASASGAAEDVSVREYRRGDDLRRVHWRTSARIGELMVRREEQPWEAHATVVLDNRERAHRGHGHTSSLEGAVIAVASVAAHLEQHGYRVQVATADGVIVNGSAAALKLLASIQASERSTLDVGWSGDQTRGGVVVAVLGAIDEQDTANLRRIRHDAGAALALVLDVAQWSDGRANQDPEAITAPLRTWGWRAVAVSTRDRLDLAWRELGRSPAPLGSRK